MKSTVITWGYTWLRSFVHSALLMAAGALGSAQSYYPIRLDDAKATYLTSNSFPVHADGQTDDTAAIQSGIDAVRDRHGEGILFVPEGRYLVSRTIYVWPGVRVIGYGVHRPVFVLRDRTPGYQEGLGYMFVFAGGSPNQQHQSAEPLAGTVPPNKTVADANPGTFYSAMSNIDFELGKENAAAVAIRFHIAQHCFLTHMTFHIQSGLAALKDVGNEAEDLHFIGGQFGIITGKPSPGWQFTLLDSTFEGQRTAAIDEHEAGLTLVHDTFRNLPQAVAIDPNYPDELWIRDSVFDDIPGSAITISNENSRRTEISVDNVVCRKVPVFAKLRESSKLIAGNSEIYQVKSFSHGLQIPRAGVEGHIGTEFDSSALTQMPLPSQPAIAPPPPESSWVNLKTLGAVGDGVADDSAAIQKAIDTHKALYIPTGRYVVKQTIKLAPDTVLIGLDPSTTQFDLPDGTAAFQGPGSPQPLMMAPAGGADIVSGIGLYTNGRNSRATALLWRAGPKSLVDDVRFLGGHGTNGADGKRVNPYNNTHTADPDLSRRWDAQYPSLWVADGGGGTFADIWTPDTYAQAGLYVSDTSTRGYVYELSSEHHVRNEVKLVKVSNWELDALQTEEERGESSFALPLSIDRCRNITVANFHSYRVVSSYQPARTAIEVHGSEAIRLRNVHVDSDSKAAFDDSVVEEPAGREVRDHELASLTFKSPDTYGAGGMHSRVPVQARGPEQLASGFFNVSGGASDAKGNLYFVDAHRQQILRWSPSTQDLTIVRDAPLDPANLVIDKSGEVLVTSYAGDGSVYTFRPNARLGEMTLLKPEPATAHAGMTPWLAADYWVNGGFDEGAVPQSKWAYISPDRSMFIPADSAFVEGALYYGVKMAPVLRAFGLSPAVPGHPFYITDESQERTYRTTVNASGAMGPLTIFAENGGESVVQDVAGRVYLAAGQVYVYSPQGQLLSMIRVPERPIDLVFGGRDRRTLFILTHTSLYAVHVGSAGL